MRAWVLVQEKGDKNSSDDNKIKRCRRDEITLRFNELSCKDQKNITNINENRILLNKTNEIEMQNNEHK